MENLSLEERVLYRTLCPSLPETNMLSGRTDIQYLEEGKKIISYFKNSLKEEEKKNHNLIQFSTSSSENFIKFYTHLQESWRTYLNLSSKMASFSENLQFLFPEKLKLFQRLIQTTFNLNSHLYFITDIEKEIYEKNIEDLPEDRATSLIKSVKSFPVYLSKEIGQEEVSTKNPYEIREILSKNPQLRKLFSLSGSSIQSFSKLLNHFSPINKKVEKREFIPQNKYEEALKGILVYDHFFEIFLRKSGILMNDLKFYVDLSNRISCSKEIPSLLSKIEDLRNSSYQTFNPKIPQYKQTQFSCGATCLANVVGTYFPHINVDKSLEEGILKLVTAEKFPNNLPSSLAYISREKFGIPAHFFADFKTFAPLFLNQKAKHDPVKKFQEDYERIKSSSLNYEEITTQEIKTKLEKGHFISFVNGKSPMLHYKMIVGYNFGGDKKSFHIFDPSYGTTKLDESSILSHMRNDKSLWGVEYIPPESVIFNKTIKSLSKAKEILSWKPQ